MKLTIWKFILTLDKVQGVEMPVGSEILSVQCQNDKLCVWAIVDPSARKESRTFLVKGTGFDLSDMWSIPQFVGTVQMHGGALV